MKIGITTRIIYEDGIRKQFVNEQYIDYVRKANLTPIILPMIDEIDELLEMCDAFLVTGGEDLDSLWYGEPRSLYLGKFDLYMDKHDKKVIEYAYENNKPLLGICRGLQAINVFLGGTLIQHIEDGSHKKIANNAPFEVVDNGSIFSKIYSNKSTINSYHHQAIKDLAPDFIICGYSNNMIEAIIHKEKPILGVQWHPEKIMDDESINLIKEFAKLI
jgi:putative glutamine amidotransferase